MIGVSRLRERGVIYALAASLVWHFFWFFAITVDITPIEVWTERSTGIHFIGPVLSDEWFELVLESKPAMSQTIYRPYEELAEPLEPERPVLEKDLPRDLVSIPMSQRQRASLQGLLRTEKKFPLSVYEEVLPVPVLDTPFPLSGELRDWHLLYAPEPPSDEIFETLEERAAWHREAVFEMRVNSRGSVTSVENIVSSGHPETDLAWKEYLKRWQFMPMASRAANKEAVGRVRVKRLRP